MQPARLRRFGGLRQCRLGRQHRAIGAAAADQAVEACGRHHIVTETLALEAQHAQQAPPERLHAARQVAGARVGAADVGAERAANAGGVVLVEKTVVLVLAPVGGNAGDQLAGRWDQRRAVPAPSDHGIGQVRALLLVMTRLLVDEPPEAGDVLLQLAEHEIAAVATQVATVRGVQGRGQALGRCIEGRVEHGPLAEQPILVAIAQQHLAQGQHVAELELVAPIERQLAVPIDLRLADAVREAERLDGADIERREPHWRLEGTAPAAAGDLLSPRPRACLHARTASPADAGSSRPCRPRPIARVHRC